MQALQRLPAGTAHELILYADPADSTDNDRIRFHSAREWDELQSAASIEKYVVVDIAKELPHGAPSTLVGDQASCEVVVLINTRRVIRARVEEALRNNDIVLEYKEARNHNGDRVFNQVSPT
jgi:hypothetical protein